MLGQSLLRRQLGLPRPSVGGPILYRLCAARIIVASRGFAALCAAESALPTPPRHHEGAGGRRAAPRAGSN